MQFINITPTNLIGKVGNTTEMALTHLLLNNDAYRDAMAKQSQAGIPMLVDNSYFELGYCLSPGDMLAAVYNMDSEARVTMICPDGTRDGMEEFKLVGHKVMCIPKTVEQFLDFMHDTRIDLVGVSEEHFDRRHSIGARYNLFKNHMPAMASKKIHLLGGTDTLWELALLSPFANYIHSWDTSMPVWQGHLGHSIDRQVSKDTTGVDFDVQVDLQKDSIQHNLKFVENMIKEYYEK